MPTLTAIRNGDTFSSSVMNANYLALNRVFGVGSSITGYTTGDMPYASGTTALDKLAISATPGRGLGVSSSLPAWSQAYGLRKHYRRLLVTRPSASTVTVTADSLVVENAAATGLVMLQDVSVTPDLTASGANGLDTGSEASGTWYYVWVIYNPTTGTVAGLFSTASAIGSITFPSGYTHGLMVSAARNDGSSNLMPYRQNGTRVWHAGDTTNGPPNLFTNQTGSLSGTTETPTALVPPGTLTTEIFGWAGTDQSTADGGMYLAGGGAFAYAAVLRRHDTMTVTMGWGGGGQFFTQNAGTGLTHVESSTAANAFRGAISGFKFDI